MRGSHLADPKVLLRGQLARFAKWKSVSLQGPQGLPQVLGGKLSDIAELHEVYKAPWNVTKFMLLYQLFQCHYWILLNYKVCELHLNTKLQPQRSITLTQLAVDLAEHYQPFTDLASIAPPHLAADLADLAPRRQKSAIFFGVLI
jgi:hypothetical protein